MVQTFTLVFDGWCADILDDTDLSSSDSGSDVSDTDHSHDESDESLTDGIGTDIFSDDSYSEDEDGLMSEDDQDWLDAAAQMMYPQWPESDDSDYDPDPPA